jgi:EamA domain-containing membrane protein RarD
MNLSVKEKGIQSQNNSGQGKNDGKGCGGAATMVGITTVGGNVSRCFFQLGKHAVDVKATSGIGVKVRVVATIHVVFALGRSIVGTFAQIEDLVVVVVIVVVGVVTVVAVVVVVAVV